MHFRTSLQVCRAGARRPARLLCATFALLAFLPGCAAPQPRESKDAGAATTQPATPVRVALPENAIWLEQLDLTAFDQGWSTAKAAKSVDGKPLTINGKQYDHGVGSHSYGEFHVDLLGCAREFRATVGVDDEVTEYSSVQFVVLVDDVERFRSPVLRPADDGVDVRVDLRNARYMTLIIEDAGDGNGWDHADFAGAMILLETWARQMPVAMRETAEDEPKIAMGIDPRPRINAPRITGATPGRPFLFRIPASGRGPLRFSASNLPAGLMLDARTGVISGSLRSDGRWEVPLVVTGPRGQSRSTLTIVSGPDALALTPPMGWNSWNAWGLAVDDAKVRAAADAFERSGLAAFGYQYINIDDGWELDRDPAGFIRTNEKFPDMKSLSAYVHSKGLKLGIYSSPGPKTCGQFEGSHQHELQDAQKYAEWGIDLLKYDWCSYGTIAKDESLEELQKPYFVMRDALASVDRDIVFSLCQYGLGDVSTWGETVGGHYWRTTGDITDTWSSMATIGFGQAGKEPYAKPGNWNDPDMLVVGHVGWGPNLHPTKLTKNEQITHMTLWSLLAAPLLIGCDLSQLDPFTLAILTNPEVLDVSQDPLGRQAHRVRATGAIEVWARPMADGSMAVGLFNRGWKPARIEVSWAELGVDSAMYVRNLWTRTPIGIVRDAFAADVARHGAVMIRIWPPAIAPQASD